MLPLLLPLPLTDVGVEGDVESDVPVVVVVVDEEDESLEGSCGRASRWSLTERTSSSSELRLGGSISLGRKKKTKIRVVVYYINE